MRMYQITSEGEWAGDLIDLDKISIVDYGQGLIYLVGFKNPIQLDNDEVDEIAALVKSPIEYLKRMNPDDIEAAAVWLMSEYEKLKR